MKPWLLALAFNLGASATIAQAAGDPALLQKQCSECHALTPPTAPRLERLWERTGPDLHYAGNKFKRDWLVAWLQSPTVIRPAGVMYAKVVKASADRQPDVIDETKVPAHLKLSKGDAEKAADALMSLKAADGLVKKGAFKNEAVNAAFASMLFSKLRGCSSCHASKPGNGGASGPELYTAGDRLQPDFIVAYINDPQKFDPHIWMPTLGLTDADVQKLTGYIATLKSAEKK
jgi:mono/diheme cytochrome c family protein